MARYRQQLTGLVVSILVGVSGCVSATEADLAEIVHSLIGFSDFSAISPAPMGKTGCINQGGGLLFVQGNELGSWSLGQATCAHRTVILMERTIASSNSATDWQIVDALALPVMRRGDELFEQGDCEFDGKTDTSFFAIVHLGRRERVDHRNGVLAAWTADPQAGKIVALDTKRVVCYRPTPP